MHRKKSIRKIDSLLIFCLFFWVRQFPLSVILLFWRITIVFPHILLDWTYNNSVFLSLKCHSYKQMQSTDSLFFRCGFVKAKIFTQFWQNTMTHFLPFSARWRPLLKISNGLLQVKQRSNVNKTKMRGFFCNPTKEKLQTIYTIHIEVFQFISSWCSSSSNKFCIELKLIPNWFDMNVMLT